MKGLFKLANLAYVDDLAFGANSHQQLQIQAQAVAKYFSFYALEVGIDDKYKTKTAIMTVGESPELREQITFALDGKILPIPMLKKNESYKYLRIHFQPNLMWSLEVNAIKKKLHHACRVFRLQKNIPIKYIQYTVNNIILPIIDNRSRVIVFDNILKDFRQIIIKTIN